MSTSHGGACIPLIAPSWNVDLVEALTELCRLLAIGLPKN